MNTTVRLPGRIGPHALLITTAVPLTGWAVHAVALHRKLSGARRELADRRDSLTGLLGRDGYTTRARQITDRYGNAALVVFVDLDHVDRTTDG